MSLATGEEQQVALHFSRSLIWSDFIEKAAFTFMYDGEIHSDVVPNTGGSGGRIDGNDGELLIDIREWSVPTSDVNITLELGHKDWVLLGITYDDRYQLKPQDLIGLKMPGDLSLIASGLASGQKTTFELYPRLYSAVLANNAVTFEVLSCNPAVENYAASFNTDDTDVHVITEYLCDNDFSVRQLEEDLQSWLIGQVGFQPSQIQSCTMIGYTNRVSIPIAYAET